MAGVNLARNGRTQGAQRISLLWLMCYIFSNRGEAGSLKNVEYYTSVLALEIGNGA